MVALNRGRIKSDGVKSWSDCTQIYLFHFCPGFVLNTEG